MTKVSAVSSMEPFIASDPVRVQLRFDLNDGLSEVRWVEIDSTALRDAALGDTLTMRLVAIQKTTTVTTMESLS